MSFRAWEESEPDSPVPRYPEEAKRSLDPPDGVKPQELVAGFNKEIVQLYDKGETIQSIAARFDLAPSSVALILRSQGRQATELSRTYKVARPRTT